MDEVLAAVIRLFDVMTKTSLLSDKDVPLLTFLLILTFSSLKKYRNKVLENTRTKRTSFYNFIQSESQIQQR